MLTGLPGAEARMTVLVKWRPVARRLERLAAQTPQEGRAAMAEAVRWWAEQAIPHLPVRGSGRATQKGRPKYTRVGRGQLKRRTQPFVHRVVGGGIEGGLVSMVPYAIWLAAGTRKIAKGRVMRWRPGQPLITSWPAKKQGGSPSGALPILLPWHRKARNRLVSELRKRLLP